MSTSASFVRDSSSVYRVPELTAIPWLVHGFGTRESGVWPGRLAMLKQIHSTMVVAASGETGYVGDGDALISDLPGLMIGVRTADCVPILLVDPKRRAVGAVHAGWRGAAGQIVERTIEEMSKRYGVSAGDLLAAIGPAIGRCCYEVGPEVAARFAPWFPELAGSAAPVRLDLIEANKRQVEQSGVSRDRIFDGGMCTSCTPAELHSYRRDGPKAGRMIAAIGITG